MIEITEEAKHKLMESIKRYFLERMDETIGDLKASLFLEFCLKEIGPIVYNQAVSDAQAYMHGRIDDMDGSCYETEFGYWREHGEGGGRTRGA